MHILRFVFSSRCRLFRNSIFFGFCNIHILNTECAKIFKENSGAKGLNVLPELYISSFSFLE